jgi:hypothetical protein
LVGDPITVADFNQSVRDNTNWLYGDTAWQSIGTFTNGWTAGSPPPQYRRSGNIVTLRGLVTGGTNSTPAFALPVGYIPYSPLFIACVANTALYCIAAIALTGAVTPGLTSPEVGIYLDSIHFDVRP